jgi:heme exporter protein B
MKYWSQILAVTRKDIISEFRTREIIVSVLMFTLLVIIIFNFAFGSTQAIMNAAAPGMLWITFAFAGVLALNRSFIVEKEEGCLEGLMVSPVSREIIYSGKMLGSLVFMLVVEVVALPIFALLFNLNVITLQIITVTLLATIGFVACGTLFSALAVKTKARELVLPILFLPIIVPVMIAAVKASASALAGGAWSDITGWLIVIVAFDAVFVVVSLWVFNFVIEE